MKLLYDYMIFLWTWKIPPKQFLGAKAPLGLRYVRHMSHVTCHTQKVSTCKILKDMARCSPREHGIACDNLR